MVLGGYLLVLFTSPSLALTAMTEAGNMSVSLTLNLIAINSIWMGIMAIVEKTGLNEKLGKLFRPIIRFLFKDTPEETDRYLALNMSANLLGLGSAATPMGIMAMKSMDDGSGRATDNMLMLIVLNATSLQILPTTLISLRSQAGSASPADIILPALTSSLINLIIGVTIVKLLNRIKRPRRLRGTPLNRGDLPTVKTSDVKKLSSAKTKSTGEK
jgi:spore maturation protein A